MNLSYWGELDTIISYQMKKWWRHMETFPKQGWASQNLSLSTSGKVRPQNELCFAYQSKTMMEWIDRNGGERFYSVNHVNQLFLSIKVQFIRSLSTHYLKSPGNKYNVYEQYNNLLSNCL